MANTFWEDFGSSGLTYQMGEQPQRLEIFKIAEDYGCDSMLDIGCGTGPLYEILKKNNIPLKYKGVDYSSSFIKTCQREFPEARWEVQDARQLNEKDGSWDCCVLLHALDHVDNYDKVLTECYRVARKVCILVLWRPFVDSGKTNTNSKNQDFEDSHLTDFDKVDLESSIIDAGFSIGDSYEMKTERYNFVYVLEK